METKDLITEYSWLRDEMAANGPSERLRVARRLLNQTMQLYRLEQRYEKAKTKYPIHIEFLETDTPLTAQDAANLKAASAVNRQITEVLRGWHRGRTAGVAS